MIFMASSKSYDYLLRHFDKKHSNINYFCQYRRLTWKTLGYFISQVSRNGISSTYVENTCRHYERCNDCKDHLHIRGEHFCKSLVNKGGDKRITSTYVENTQSLSGEMLWIRDHLHIRGEHPFIFALGIAGTGSPPHTWRTPWNFREI